MRFLPLTLALGLLLTATASAQELVPDILRRHSERARQRLTELKTLRTEGRTFLSGESVAFTTIAQRPNRLRVESFTPQRRVIQAYDGVRPPWISHSEIKAGQPELMSEADARDFMRSADFDDPLIDATAKGYSVNYAGEDKLDGNRCFKLLLSSARERLFFLWVNADTYEIVKRLVYRQNGDQRVAVETFFSDFKPVAGVLQPCRIETLANGQLIYSMVVHKIEANVPIAPGTFERVEP